MVYVITIKKKLRTENMILKQKRVGIKQQYINDS